MLSFVIVGMIGIFFFGDSIQKNEKRELRRLQRGLYKLK